MSTLTNQQQLTEGQILFLVEALPYVDVWTPTDINGGGCGVFAEMFSNILDKYSIEHKIIALTRKEEEGDEQEENFLKFIKRENETANGAGVAHIVIKIDNFYFDSTGIMNLRVKFFEQYELSKEQLHQLIKEGMWNGLFDKSCTGSLKERLEEAFKSFATCDISMVKWPKNAEELKVTGYTAQKRAEHQGMGGLYQILKRRIRV